MMLFILIADIIRRIILLKGLSKEGNILICGVITLLVKKKERFIRGAWRNEEVEKAQAAINVIKGKENDK